ncbi:MAG: ABC transporter substrate-binding protein [Rhodothermales bacterium]
MRLTIVITAILSLLLSACDSNNASQCDTVVIGVGLPLSGGSEGTGQNVLRALSLAVDDANAQGGVDGRDVELMVRDDGSGVSQSVVRSGAEDFASDECVVAVVGHLNSSATLWAQQVYDDEHIVNFTPASTASSIASNSEWTFRNITHNGYKGLFLADYAKGELGLRRVGVIFDDDAFGTDLETFFVDEADKIGLRIVGDSSYSRTQTEPEIEAVIAASVAKDLAAGAEAIYAAGVLNEGVIVVNEVRSQAGADMPIIWSGWEEPLLIEQAGANAEGVLVPIHRVYDESNPDVSAFKSRFESRFGQPPGAFAPFAYDAFGMIVRAAREAGTDRTAIRDYLASIDTADEAYAGLTGQIYFDEAGDPAEHFVSALVVRNGEFVPFGD